jgi:hypothetical protein
MGALSYDLSSSYHPSSGPSVLMTPTVLITLNNSQPDAVYQSGLVFSQLYSDLITP